MSEQGTTKDQLFNSVREPLYINKTYFGEVNTRRDGIYLCDAYLSTDEARQLRDWLNKVLP